jgi:uncharacterized protein involved in exopolysaccharide biosynthesis
LSLAADAPSHRVMVEAQHPFRTHSVFILVFVLSAAVSTLTFTYFYSEQYQSEATIFFQPQAHPRVNAQQLEAFGSPVPNAPFKVIGQTLSELAKSDALLRTVVTELRLDDNSEDDSGPWYSRIYRRGKDSVLEMAGNIWSILKFGRIIEEDPTTKAINNLRKHTKIEQADSYVFTVRTFYKRPDTAASIADAIAEQLVGGLRDQDQLQAAAQTDELRKLLDEKTERIETVDEKIRDLLLSYRIGALPKEVEQATVRLSEYRLSLSHVDAQLQQEEARLKEISVKLGLPGEPGAPRAAPTAPVPVPVEALQTYTRFATERISAEINVAGLRENRNSIQESITEQEKEVERLTQVQVEYDLLSNELENAKRDLIVLSGALEEARMRKYISASDLRIEAKANVPEEPSSPIKLYHVGLAALLAAMVSSGLATLLDYFGIDYFANRSDKEFGAAT